MRRLEISGGTVSGQAVRRLTLPPRAGGYADAQLDDYGGLPRGRYPWRPGMGLSLTARFSHGAAALRGTAGFGLWNAPFGDPTTRRPALPQAAWFFFASPPNDLPLNPAGPGRGWFAGTVDATTARALALVPLAPLVVLLNRWPRWRRMIWPRVQHRLGMSYRPLTAVDLTAWHHYELSWQPHQTTFKVDGQPVLETTQSPRGPLGFVCWIDNQFLSVTPSGRVRAGVVEIPAEQWLEVKDLTLARTV